MGKENNNHTDNTKPLEFEEDLTDVEISDDAIKADDSALRHAKKHARKYAKGLRTPSQRRKRKIKIIAAGLLILLALLAGLLIVQRTRWWLLNAVGIRANIVVSLSERVSKQPLKDVTLLQSGQPVGTSDSKGAIVLSSFRLGPQSFTTKKAGYSDETYSIINKPFQENKVNFTTRAIGVRIDVTIKDWLNETPLSGSLVALGENAVKTDKTGSASIIVPPDDSKKLKLKISRDGYLSKTIDVDTSVRDREITLVSSEKDYFISKRDGKFDIFSSNIDGSDQKKIIEATGQENEDLLQFSVRSDNRQAVLVSTRDGRKQNNRIVAGIYQVDFANSSLKKIDEASDVELLGWVDNSMVYRKFNTAANYDSPVASSITSFNTSNGKLSDIASANYFSVSLVAQKKVFYQPADAFRPIENANLTSLELSNGAKKTYLIGQQIVQASYSNFDAIRVMSSDSKTHELQIRSGVAKEVSLMPNSINQFVYNTDNNQFVWTEQTDGQGALLLRDVAGGGNRLITKIGGMTRPARFVSSNLAIVRIVTNQETADYAVSLVNGRSVKISDVFNVSSFRY